MKILLLGKDGQVGWELQRSLAMLGELKAVGRSEVDLDNIDTLCASVRDFHPTVVVNAAAYTAVDKAESSQPEAHVVNAAAPGVLAEEAARCGAWIVHYSTDYVFDGTKASPYVETDATNPLSVYGKTKCEGEERVRANNPRHLILRTSWVYAARGGNFAKTMLRLAGEREELNVVADQHGAPTSAELLADATALALARIARDGAAADALAGTYHLAASGATTWHGYAQHVLELAQGLGFALKAGPSNVHPIATEAYPLPAPRPRNSRLDCEKFSATFGIELPDWRHHVRRLVTELA